MNLNTIYDLFFNGGDLTAKPLWPGKREQKKLFFMGRDIIPYEIRRIKLNLWNDKTRRSKFFSNSNSEPKYVESLTAYILENPFIISRIEYRCFSMVKDKIDVEKFSDIMKKCFQKYNNYISQDIIQYIMGESNKKIYTEYWKAIAFLIIYAMLDVNVNEVYRKFFLYVQLENKISNNDRSTFINEYPADGQEFEFGEKIKHTWVLKNQGTVVWENRYCKCLNPEIINKKINLDINLPQKVFPGEMIEICVEFTAPDKAGIYELMWKMKTSNGSFCYPEDIGLGLHFSVKPHKNISNANNEIALLMDEIPNQVSQYKVGDIVKHTWILKNVGHSVWKEYFFECANFDTLKYAKNELRIPIKKNVKVGQIVRVDISFIAPFEAGVYFFIWKIRDKDGKDLLPETRGIWLQIIVYE